MGKTVMVVDDSFVMRTLIKKIVESEGTFEIVGEAANGVKALELVASTKPDLVLMDIEMPEMDGLECLKRLKLVSKAKVIIISSVAQVGSPQALEARKLGAVNVIPKPSGALSLNLQETKGSEIVQALQSA